MGSPADWKFIADVLTTLNNRVRDGWAASSLPADLTGDAAKQYLTDFQARLDVVEKFVAQALDHPIAYDVGREIGHVAAAGARRAAKVARDISSDMADTFEKTADRLASGGETVAKSIGLGAGIALIALLIFLARKA